MAPNPKLADLARRYGELAKVPRHVAIIMDGNGRWARARGLPRLAGHRAGTDNIRPVLEGCVEFGVQILTIYAFSTENWDRPPDEVHGLFGIFGGGIYNELGTVTLLNATVSGNVPDDCVGC